MAEGKVCGDVTKSFPGVELDRNLTCASLPVQSPRGDRKGLLSPRRKSDTSAFQAFMTPQKRNGEASCGL